MKKIITIGREFGSGGRFIGESVAKRLGISYYDKEIISKVAEQSGFAREYIAEQGEYAPTKSIFGYAYVGRNSVGQSLDDMIYQVQREIILELAEKEPCVIIGRNADYILRDRDDCLNVFISGNMPEKIKRVCKLYEKYPEDAKKLINTIDKRRSSHYKYYSDQTWGKASNYTICLNSSDLGYDKCIDIIEEIYKL